jgi:hypothetical protein
MGAKGTIPTEIGNCVNLKELAFWAVDLEGTIPLEIGNLKKLGTSFEICIFFAMPLRESGFIAYS